MTKIDVLCGKNIKQIAGGGLHVLLLLNDGSVYGFGSNKHGQLGKFPLISLNLDIGCFIGLGNTHGVETPTLIRVTSDDDRVCIFLKRPFFSTNRQFR